MFPYLQEVDISKDAAFVWVAGLGHLAMTGICLQPELMGALQFRFAEFGE